MTTFDPVDPKQSFPALEKDILTYWREEDTFKRSMHARKNGKRWSFYDGPPFATGLPHYGHILAGTIKDVIPRYQTMRGHYVERRFGWDCHGLPIENLIEKEHDITSPQQIEEMGIGAFNQLCRASVQRYAKEWQQVVERMGRWVDMDWDYRTMDSNFMESIWWVFHQLAEKGLIYEGHKPMHVCPRCVTPLSNFEVTQGYKDVTDASVIAKFKVSSPSTSSEQGKQQMANSKMEEVYFLAWTTTPWTLPGNLFLAVAPDVTYESVRYESATYIVAAALREQLFKDKEHVVTATHTGKDFVGMTYEPLFPYFAEKYPTAFRVVAGDFVTTDDGTGIVHIAPGFGDDDYQVGKREGVPVLQHIHMDGRFVPEVTDFAGQEVKPMDDPAKTDRRIAEYLKEKGLLWSTVSYKHSYPHCWRCDSPLLNYATSSWFVAVEKIKEQLLAANKKTEWVPEGLRDGRFGKWLENARDWAISRNRFWGTPLPVWRTTDKKHVTVMGSQDSLAAAQTVRFTKLSVLRHGESEGNLIPIYQGAVPGTNLTTAGREQAKLAAEYLRKEPSSKNQVPSSTSQIPTIIYCSPLARTKQTAEIIAKELGGIPVVVDDRLREVTFGPYEGKTVDFGDLAMVKAKRAHKFATGKPESIYHFEGMETWTETHARMEEFLREKLPLHRSEHVAVVTHADLVQNCKAFFTGTEALKLSHQPYPEYASPVSFMWDHDREAALDLHRETVDDIFWPEPKAEPVCTVTLVRHGETPWNVSGTVQGNAPDAPGLTENGRAQAEALAKTLQAKDYDVILCSPLARAKETAEILSKALNLPVSDMWNELEERNAGVFRGKPLAAFTDAHGTAGLEYKKIAMHPATPESGESLSQFLARARSAYERMLREYAGKRLLVVTHGGFMQAFRTFAENLSYAEATNIIFENGQTLTYELRPLMKRIPEVLDCWFESGSMPYAQQHFPFAFRSTPLPPGFPADFIAEGIDQTRGWFYTLTVLATALYGEPAFKHCVVNGTVLAADGRKMSKRLKNYPEPTEVAERHGADAVRFALMRSPAVRAEDLRFTETVVEDSVRNVLLPLWHTYSFLVTYANGAKWQPGTSRTHSSHELDKYLRTEVQDLVNRMTEQLDTYDLSATCNELFTTIDALTNWYVRLSRRRFAGKGDDLQDAQTESTSAEQAAALDTLYDCLLTLCQLLAPFCPFISEHMYLNLTKETHGSIHLTDWPTPKTLDDDERSLLEKMRTLRAVISLGQRLRSEKKIKVRQPLTKATVAIPQALQNVLNLSDSDVQLIRQELNVKEVHITADPGSLAEVVALVDARKTGPRFGKRVQEIIAAGKRGEFTTNADGTVSILGETLSAEEVNIQYRGKEGTDVAADAGLVVQLDTNVSDTLQLEGLVRDVIRGVQKLRKDSGLQFTDIITLQLDDFPEAASFADILERETNARLGKSTGEAQTIDLDERTVTVRFHVTT